MSSSAQNVTTFVDSAVIYDIDKEGRRSRSLPI